jgi:prefoldin subunit 5
LFRKNFLTSFIFIILLSFSLLAKADNVPKTLFGLNAWMPKSIGQKEYFGKLDQVWDKVEDSNPNLIRLGGIAADHSFYTNEQLIDTLKKIKSAGAKAIVQVPLDGGKFSAENAARIVKFINKNRSNRRLRVKYWSIGNEPNLMYKNYSPMLYAQHVKAFSIAMKKVDPRIKIIAGEMAWFDRYWVNSLLGGDADITGVNPATKRPYIDYFSFHAYGFGITAIPQTRETALEKLQQFENAFIDLKERLATINKNKRKRRQKIKAMITEFNINWLNPEDNSLTSVGADSFFAGQWIANILAIGAQQNIQSMQLWSIIEGSSDYSDIGYLTRKYADKKPMYHHYQMMARYYQGKMLTAKSNKALVRVTANTLRRSKRTNVFVFNYDQENAFHGEINLNGKTPSAELAISVNAIRSRRKDITYPFYIKPETTRLFQFDRRGRFVAACNYNIQEHAWLGLAPSCDAKLKHK